MVVTLALVAIFFAGVMYIVSTGDENMMTKAKGFLKVGLIGFSVVIGAWLIVNVAMWILGAREGSDEGGTLGIKIESWHTFTCDTKSSQGTGGTGGASGSPQSSKYICNEVDVNKDGTIDSTEKACLANPNGTMSYTECLNKCSTSSGPVPTTKCGSNNEGVCIDGLSCTDLGLTRLGECQDGRLCCK